ncbi:MAG: L,D-transpeptidase [Parachlamydiaceae bacterium]
MSLPKIFAFITLLLFAMIGAAALFKKRPEPTGSLTSLHPQVPIEVALDDQEQIVVPALASHGKIASSNHHSPVSAVDLPDANLIEELFNKSGSKLPIVETITYKSHVPWQKGRPAWLSDYASHYTTSRHFIARSLNGKPDYLKQELTEGDKFNVLRKDKNFEFYLVVDTSRCRMWFYYLDLDENQSVLLKTYNVGLGRLDAAKTSGLLTPLGKYSLGNRVAIFKPKVTGNYQGKKVEMITIFGSRWIPFEKEIGQCTAPAKGFGIHGTPWALNPQGVLADSGEGVGKYESDGCIRLATSDIEELFAITISRPTTIEIVRDFSESSVTHTKK